MARKPDSHIHSLRILKAIILLADEKQKVTVAAVRQKTGCSEYFVKEVLKKLIVSGNITREGKTYLFSEDGLANCRKYFTSQSAPIIGQRYIKPGKASIVDSLRVADALVVAEMLEMNTRDEQLYTASIAHKLSIDTARVRGLIEALRTLNYLYLVQHDRRKLVFKFTVEGKRACYRFVIKTTEIFE